MEALDPHSQRCRDGTKAETSASEGDQGSIRQKGALGFQHPVRLYMPRSKCHEYLHHLGEKALAGFPVQATIHFYDDDSDSEDDDEAEFCQVSDRSAASAEMRLLGTRDRGNRQTAECLEGDSAAGEAACASPDTPERRTSLQTVTGPVAMSSTHCTGSLIPVAKCTEKQPASQHPA